MPLRIARDSPYAYYNLPPDYETLSMEGQKLARVNAIQLRETPDELVAAWRFLKRWYLMPDEEAEFDPSFYQDAVKACPMHEQWVYDVGRYSRNVIVAPRGFAKSTVIGKELPLLNMLGGRVYPSLIVLSKDDAVELRFTEFMIQIENNDRIKSDFGELKPAKGEAGSFNKHLLYLRNGAICVGTSIESINRGYRTKFLLFDDCEYDPENKTASDRLRAAFQSKFKRIFAPMIKRGSKVCAIGTSHRKDMFLYHMATAQDDPIFNDRTWNRKRYVAIQDDGTSSWEEANPLTFLEEQKATMGTAAFESEYMNNPTAEGSRSLTFNDNTCGYVVEGAVGPEPFVCAAPCAWVDMERRNADTVPVPQRQPFMHQASKLFRMITVDYAYSDAPDSDNQVIHVLGTDRLNQIWSLDLWSGKVRTSALLDLIWMYAFRWNVRVIGVEAVMGQQALAAMVADRAAEMRSAGQNAPAVLPLKYKSKKEERIAALGWRFERGLIKLPLHRRKEKSYGLLFSQIEGFVADQPNGGLPHDDELDTLGMVQEIIQAPRPDVKEVSGLSDTQMRILKGEKFDAIGIPLVFHLPPEQITSDIVMAGDLLYNRDKRYDAVPSEVSGI